MSKNLKQINGVGTVKPHTAVVVDELLTVAVELVSITSSMRRSIDRAIKRAVKKYESNNGVVWGGGAEIDSLSIVIELSAVQPNYYIITDFNSPKNENQYTTATVYLKPTISDKIYLNNLALLAVMSKFF